MASDLPEEVWVKVLARVGASIGRDVCFGAARSAYRKQKCLLGLPLVCRKFKSTFEAEPDLVSTIALPATFKEESVLSLSEWARQHTASIQTILADCGSPQVDIALAGLGSRQAALQRVFCHQCSTCSIQLLSTLTRLTSCSLSSSVEELDLSPLASLPALDEIELTSGSFTTAQLPVGLQSLSMYKAELFVGPTCNNMKRLRKLLITDGELSFVPMGLAACGELEDLHCTSSDVLSAERHWHMLCRDGPFQIPNVVTPLAHITDLSLWYDGRSEGHLDLISMYSLRSLERLTLHSTLANVAVAQGFCALTSLTYLNLEVVGSSDGSDSNSVLQLELDTSWAELDSLQKIVIEADTLKCDDKIQGIAAIPNLQGLNFGGIRPADAHSTSSFAKLVYALANRSERNFVCTPYN